MGKQTDPQVQGRLQTLRRYRHALDRGDLAVVAAVLRTAEDDPDLEAMLLTEERLSQAHDGITVPADQLLRARHFLNRLHEEARSGANHDVQSATTNPLTSVSDKHGAICQGRVQPPQQELSLLPLTARARRSAAARLTGIPWAAAFMRPAAAILIVGALIAGFLLVFTLRPGAPKQTTPMGTQPSSPPGIYISRLDGVYRFNVQTRQVIWHTQVADQSRFPGSPVIIGDTVYITGSGAFDATNTVSAIDAQTGALRWERTFPHSVDPPALDDGLLYFAGARPGASILYAVNAATGSITATYTPRQVKSWYAPVVVDGVLYYTDDFSSDTLYAVQLPGEQLLWQQQLSAFPLNVAAGGGLVVQNGIVYLPVTPETPSQQGWIDAFDAHTGQPLWQSPAMTIADGASTLAITDTMIYVASLLGNRGTLLAFDLHTYALVWQEPFEAFDMQVASGTLYIVNDIDSNESFAALNASTGKLLWQTPINRVGGDMLTGVLDGVVYCVAWTTFDGNAVSGSVYGLNASDGTQIWALPTGATVSQWGGMVVA
jgi:outer membrane protein assembly factor BamB